MRYVLTNRNRQFVILEASDDVCFPEPATALVADYVAFGHVLKQLPVHGTYDKYEKAKKASEKLKTADTKVVIWVS